MSNSPTRAKTLGRTDMVLFTVSAILLLDTLTAAASVGASSIFWWLFLGVVFFIPFAMICAEMGCTYPAQGGIYVWIRDAFGKRWASRASWSYWVNTAVWIPAIFILFAGVFKQLFMPDLSLTAQILMGLVLLWLTVLVNSVTLDIGKWIPNLGAILKVLVFIAIIIGAVTYVSNHGMATPLTWETIQPSWGSSIQYIPAIVYGMLGFELVSASSDEMKDPARDVPRSVFISGFIIIVLYTAATAAVLAALPAENIDLVEGLVDTLQSFFGGTPMGDAFVLALGVAALYTFFSNGVTWSLGCNRAAAEASLEGELPRFLGVHSKKRGTPVGASIAMGVFGSVTLVLYGFLSNSNEDLFWSLFAFSAVIFLLPYLGMLLAFIKSRVREPERHRPYAVPGGTRLAIFLAGICLTVLGLCVVLFMYTPGEGVEWAVVMGVVAMLACGEVLIELAERRIL